MPSNQHASVGKVAEGISADFRFLSLVHGLRLKLPPKKFKINFLIALKRAFCIPAMGVRTRLGELMKKRLPREDE